MTNYTLLRASADSTSNAETQLWPDKSGDVGQSQSAQPLPVTTSTQMPQQCYATWRHHLARNRRRQHLELRLPFVLAYREGTTTTTMRVKLYDCLPCNAKHTVL